MFFQKDSMTFALYRSNWTEFFDMKYKKLVFLKKGMNDAHHQKLQYIQGRESLTWKYFIKYVSHYQHNYYS